MQLNGPPIQIVYNKNDLLLKEFINYALMTTNWYYLNLLNNLNIFSFKFFSHVAEQIQTLSYSKLQQWLHTKRIYLKQVKIFMKEVMTM